MMSLHSSEQGSLNPKQKYLVFTLFLLTFTVGTSEFIIIGLLNNIADSLNYSISNIGILVTAFAVAFAIGTPILTAALSRFSKYPILLIVMLIFIAGNIGSALSDNFTMLLLSRILTAIVTGVLIAMAMTVASIKIPSEKVGKAISIIFSGFTVAAVLGVPIGTYIGENNGWKMTFWSVAILGIILLVISIYTIPKDLKGNKGTLKQFIRFIVHRQVLLSALIPALSIGATYAVYTFLTPLLEQAIGVPAKYISVVLLLFGVVSIFSNLVGGTIAAKNGVSKLRFIFIVQAIVLGSLYFTSHHLIVGLLNIGFMSLLMYIQGSSLQMYFVQIADRYFSSAKDLASSLTPISLNIGIALGSVIGSWATNSIGLIHVTWVGALIAVAASIVTFISIRFNN
ncbi:MFS transporter [Fictibacillus aquaticus]|uniref:MFS transporter n=1 Tax=Fictibacillus aquaticus TaxID=2021314 RepID=A0A235F950_9BACL|nr:MFS transporter [Fictibacillus aquaticus]OYD57614.1 MFS transporter [Fictibacillus aquaticus]